MALQKSTTKITAVSLAFLFMATANAAAPARKNIDPVEQVRNALVEVSHVRASDAKVASFTFRSNKIYEIYIRPGLFTTFNFPKGEVIKQFAIDPDAGETVVNPDTNTAMLRLESKFTTPATIVTSKNTYYMTIIPAPTGQWMQGVSWGDGEDGSSNSFGYAATGDSGGEEFSSNAEDALAGQPNFEYAIDGDKSVAPVAVWDNGRNTWLQFSSSVQSLPAVFFLGPNGPEVINYTVVKGGRQIKINRLMSKMMLRLGNQKATVTAK